MNERNDSGLLIPKALEYCTLGHVLSLWETLSVELAKLLTLTDQVYMLYIVWGPAPFATRKGSGKNRTQKSCSGCAMYYIIINRMRHRAHANSV